MQISQAFSGLRVMNDQPVFRHRSTQLSPSTATPDDSFDGGPTHRTVDQGLSPLRQWSFEKALLGNMRGPLPPVQKPPLLQPSLVGDVREADGAAI